MYFSMAQVTVLRGCNVVQSIAISGFDNIDFNGYFFSVPACPIRLGLRGQHIDVYIHKGIVQDS